MASSYDKIFETILRSSRWRSFEQDFREKIQKSGIFSYKFNHRQPYGKTDYSLEPRFGLRFSVGRDQPVVDRNEDYVNEMVGDRPLSYLDQMVGSFLPDDVLDPILIGLFGTKGYPTYNCKLEKAMEKWQAFARKTIRERSQDLLTEYATRCKVQMDAILASEGFAAAKKRHYELLVINDIREVVLRFYKKVGPEVMKEALDGVIIHEIMDS